MKHLAFFGIALLASLILFGAQASDPAPPPPSGDTSPLEITKPKADPAPAEKIETEPTPLAGGMCMDAACVSACLQERYSCELVCTIFGGDMVVCMQRCASDFAGCKADCRVPC